MILHIPSDQLPKDEKERHAFLRTYFCDKDAIALLNADMWEIHLEWSGDEARHVDEKLDIGLNWWGRGVHRGNMSQARWRKGKILTALYDTWTLHSWSEWLVRNGPAYARNIVILHVDDHRDFGTPRLFMQDGSLIDAITQMEVDLYSPKTVEQSVDSGALSMGSFITPFLHTVPNAEVRHLCQPPKAKASKRYHINLANERDTLLQVGRLRPSINLQEHGSGLGTYMITPDVDTWLCEIGNRPILLHIDMDYFNNRYDGDSDWPAREKRLDPTPDEVGRKIDELVAALVNHGLGPNIEDVTIAFSPGFFPAELWSEADSRLRGALRSLV